MTTYYVITGAAPNAEIRNTAVFAAAIKKARTEDVTVAVTSGLLPRINGRKWIYLHNVGAGTVYLNVGGTTATTDDTELGPGARLSLEVGPDTPIAAIASVESIVKISQGE
jgi:hypothetical protein